MKRVREEREIVELVGMPGKVGINYLVGVTGESVSRLRPPRLKRRRTAGEVR
jgi:hypothetical protein